MNSGGMDKFYSNADSFAMAFDLAWEKHGKEFKSDKKAKEQKIDFVLSKIEDHPFFLNSPERAREVAVFRMNLLKLN